MAREDAEALAKKYGIEYGGISPSPTAAPSAISRTSIPQTDGTPTMDWMPNLGQLIGNIGGLPFGRSGRIGVGTGGRFLGEVSRQSVHPRYSSIGDAATIISGLLSGKKLDEQILPDVRHQQAQQRLSPQIAQEQFGQGMKQIGIGAGTEVLGEATMPILGKVLSAFVPPGLSIGLRNLMASRVPTKIAGSEILEQIEKQAVPEAFPTGSGRTLTRLLEDVGQKYGGKTFSLEDILPIKSAVGKAGRTLSGTPGRPVAAQFNELEANILRNIVKETSPIVSRLDKIYSAGSKTRRGVGGLIKRIVTYAIASSLLAKLLGRG